MYICKYTKYIYIGGLMEYISQKVKICSKWRVYPFYCLRHLVFLANFADFVDFPSTKIEVCGFFKFFHSAKDYTFI